MVVIGVSELRIETRVELDCYCLVIILTSVVEHAQPRARPANGELVRDNDEGEATATMIRRISTEIGRRRRRRRSVVELKREGCLERSRGLGVRVKETDGRRVEGSACLVSEMINIIAVAVGWIMIIRDLDG